MDVDLQHKIPPEAPKPHEVLWFPEGNVVLATDSLLFKVHMGILSLQSSVFKDMFELPNINCSVAGQSVGSAGIAPELYEGLPLVTLVGDEGKDVEHLLRTIYEHHYYHRDDDNTPLEVVIALLLLSTKYDFQDIRNDVIIQISKHYPMSLRDYDSIGDFTSLLFGVEQWDCHFPLLMAAFTADVDVLLPTLYMACSDYSIEGIFNQAELMPTECLRTLLKGREILEKKTNIFISELPNDLKEGAWMGDCSRNQLCLKNARYSRLSGLISTIFGDTRGSKVVAGYLNDICADCSSSVAHAIENKREEMWASVPSCYGFPGWDVLQRKLKEIAQT